MVVQNTVRDENGRTLALVTATLIVPARSWCASEFPRPFLEVVMTAPLTTTDENRVRWSALTGMKPVPTPSGNTRTFERSNFRTIFFTAWVEPERC